MNKRIGARYEPDDVRATPVQLGMNPGEELTSFIASSFRSVWSLELLLLLKKEPRHWPNGELVSRLRASDLVVSQALDSLIAAGLATSDDKGASYRPVSASVAKLVDRAEELYGLKPDLVRRTIVTSTTGGITAFAEAFRLRKD